MAHLNQSRRQFIRLSLLSPAAITLTSAYLSGCAAQSAKPTGTESQAQYFYLDNDAAAMWRAVLPPLLAGTGQQDQPSGDDINKTISRIDDGIRRFSPANRDKMGDLFTLLSITLTRGLTTGVWRDWPNAVQSDIEAFLNAWKDSNLQTLNLGYNAIVQLGALTYYGASEHWAESGYPGPPPEVTNALPQFQKESQG